MDQLENEQKYPPPQKLCIGVWDVDVHNWEAACMFCVLRILNWKLNILYFQ